MQPPMAHGRKRSFLAGCLIWPVVVGIVLGALMGYEGFRFGPPGYPHFTPASAEACVLEWARLKPFPSEAQSYTITTGGGMFTRSFRVAFFGAPAAIEQWVNSCPGIADPVCEKETAPDGTITYTIHAGGGAVFAELVHHPQRGTVQIRTYWS
jgi:hypothetical protein